MLGLESFADDRELLTWRSASQVATGEVTHIREAPFKDHIHVYHQMLSHDEAKLSRSPSNLMVPFHIDNGLYLLLTPGQPSLQVCRLGRTRLNSVHVRFNGQKFEVASTHFFGQSAHAELPLMCTMIGHDPIAGSSR